MKVGMANATKKDFDPHVALGGIASRDCRRGQRRRLTGGGIGFRLVRSWMHGETCCSRLNIASQRLRFRDLKEIETFKIAEDSYGYVFYVLQRSN